jgi:hypothetical protein
MGFFSFKCAKSNISIPAFPYARMPDKASRVVMVTPNNDRIEGMYDGYGNIGGVDVFYVIAECIYGKADRDLIFKPSHKVYKRGVYVCETYNAYWDDPLEDKHIRARGKGYEFLIGKTMNDLVAIGFKFVSIYDEAVKMIKIVRADHYNGETYEELKPSKECRAQGTMYTKYEINKIKKSL